LKYYPRVQTEPILQAELVMSLSILRLKCMHCCTIQSMRIRSQVVVAK